MIYLRVSHLLDVIFGVLSCMFVCVWYGPSKCGGSQHFSMCQVHYSLKTMVEVHAF